MAYSSPTDAFTNADVASAIPELWSDIVNEVKFAPITILNFATDLSELLSSGGDVVHVPDLFTNAFTVQTQSTQGAGVVDESPASVDVYLTVDTHKYIAFVMGDKTMKQMASSIGLHEKYAVEARDSLVQAVEDSLFGLWSSISTNTVGDTATVLTDLEIRQSIEKLQSKNYRIEDMAFFFHTYVYWNQIAGISKYYDKSVNGMESVIKTGNFGPLNGEGRFGSLYGVPVFASSRVVLGLETYRNLLLDKSAFGFAIQTDSGMIRVQSNYQLQQLATLTVADVIYGVKVLREPGAVLVNANDDATTS
jgi:hypothetical protein